MAISAGAIWRVRIGGSDTLCSGLFDPTIAGAGTDYTDQDTAQLSLTDLASTAPYTTATSAAGGFTAAMVGNGIYIPSGTGFTAGRYIITAVTNTNTAIVDRACATSAASGGVAKVGGALATITYPASSQAAVPGNIVYIRGGGLNVPIGIDYFTSAYIQTQGNGLAYVGYNGRPNIAHVGMIWYLCNNITLENLQFTVTAATYAGQGVVSTNAAGYETYSNIAYNCVFDSSGYNIQQLVNTTAIQCSFINSGPKNIGTHSAIGFTTNAICGYVMDCLVKDQGGHGITVGIGRQNVTGCIIQDCLGDGINTAAMNGGPYQPLTISRNTIYNCGGHGISLLYGDKGAVTNNIISGITVAGKYGIYSADGITNASNNASMRISRNNIVNCTQPSNIGLSTQSLSIDPQFANAPIDLTPTNTALRVIGGVGAL